MRQSHVFSLLLLLLQTLGFYELPYIMDSTAPQSLICIVLISLCLCLASTVSLCPSSLAETMLLSIKKQKKAQIVWVFLLLILIFSINLSVLPPHTLTQPACRIRRCNPLVDFLLVFTYTLSLVLQILWLIFSYLTLFYQVIIPSTL